MPRNKRKPIRRLAPWERLPMHHAGVVGGDKEVALIETPGGEFEIETRDHRYPLDAGDGEPDVHIEAENVFIINKAQIQPDDIKRLSNLEDAGIRGGIHAKRTYLMALKDGSLWIWKQTGTEERDEIFVYQLALRMFRGIVPEVQPVFVPQLGWGSAMRKVAGIPAGRVDGLHGYFHGNEEMQADLVAMLVLDYLTGNPDRHANNWFLMHNDRLAAIDNGWAGEDAVMTLSAVFEPANLAGLVRDESLWPKMLQMMLTLINDLTGRGDEARALAKEIAIDRKEAVLMVRLWEPKLQRLARFIQTEASKLQKARTYIETPEAAPAGARVETGPRGGLYYEPKGRGAAEEKKPTAVTINEETWERMEQLTQHYTGAAEDFATSLPDTGPVDWHSGVARARLKEKIAQDISKATEIRKDVVAEFITGWASSSSDDNAYSLAMQVTAAKLFDVPVTDFIEKSWDASGPGEAYSRIDVAPTYEGRKEAMLVDATQILRHVYEQTQTWLKTRGITSVTLGRGQNWHEGEVPEDLAMSDLPPDALVKFYDMRMAQYDKKEQKALDTLDASQVEGKRKDKLAERIRGQYEDARVGLENDLKTDTAGTIALIRDSAMQEVDDEWSAQMAKLHAKYRKDYASTEERDEVSARMRKEQSQLDSDMLNTKNRLRRELGAYGKWDGEVDFQQNPLSSWSADHDTVEDFSTMRAYGESVGVTMWSEVPAENIISMPFTGPGCLTEHEFLIKGGKVATYYRAVAYNRDEDASGRPERRKYLDPWQAMSEEAAATKYTMEQAKPLKQVTQLLGQGAIDEDQAETLEGYLLSGHPTKLKMALQTIAFYAQQAANQAS